MGKKIKFRVVGRKAYIDDLDNLDRVKEAFSYSDPKARFTYAFNHFKIDPDTGRPIHDADGRPVRLWDGKKSFVERGRVAVGLLLGMQDELPFDWDIKSWKNRPEIATRRGFRVEDKKYAYQNKCVDRMLESIYGGGGLVLSATGSGKTAIAAQLASHVQDPIVFVVDQLNLLRQGHKEIQKWLRQYGYKDKVGIVQSKTFDPGHVTVATIQTLHAHRRQKEFLKWAKTVKVVILDEVHKQMSRRNFTVINRFQTQMCIGLTASLQLRRKEVRMRAYSICGPVLFEFPITEGQKRGVLAKGAVIQVAVDDNPDADDFDEPYDAHVMFNPEAESAVRGLVRVGLKRGHSVIVLVERIKHLKRLQRRLSEFYPRVVYGKVSQGERERVQRKFEREGVRLIIANVVFTKGVNIRRVDVIIDAAQRKSKDDCIQKFGRGVRLHEAKDGLRYFEICTMPAMAKQAASRKTAFHREGIPVKRVQYNGSASDMYRAVDKLLERKN